MSKNWTGYKFDGGLGQRLAAVQAEREAMIEAAGGGLLARIQVTQGRTPTLPAIGSSKRHGLRERIVRSRDSQAA